MNVGAEVLQAGCTLMVAAESEHKRQKRSHDKDIKDKKRQQTRHGSRQDKAADKTRQQTRQVQKTKDKTRQQTRQGSRQGKAADKTRQGSKQQRQEGKGQGNTSTK